MLMIKAVDEKEYEVEVELLKEELLNCANYEYETQVRLADNTVKLKIKIKENHG